MGVRRADMNDIDKIAPLISGFRVELAAFRGVRLTENFEEARNEFMDYIKTGYPIFVREEDGVCSGYMVCRADEPVVWVESLYVREGLRRKGIASELFAEAERLAASYGEDTLYNFVHPNNGATIAFLSKRGYNVLNLIELRKKYPKEEIRGKITVGANEFDY